MSDSIFGVKSFLLHWPTLQFRDSSCLFSEEAIIPSQAPSRQQTDASNRMFKRLSLPGDTTKDQQIDISFIKNKAKRRFFRGRRRSSDTSVSSVDSDAAKRKSKSSAKKDNSKASASSRGSMYVPLFPQ